MDKLLLTPEEAAERLSIGRSKLYELIAAGRLRSVCIDRCRRILVADLIEYVERLGGSDDTTVVVEPAA